MRDILHDEIDALEIIQEKWRTDINQIRQDMASIIRTAQDPRDVFVEANVLAADALAERTTEAVRLGFEFGEKKAGMKNVGDPDAEDEDHEREAG